MHELEPESIEILKALADPMRLDILSRFIGTGRVQCGDIQVSCPRSQPTVSHHLAKLVESGLLLEEKTGTQKSYVLNQPLFVQFGIDLPLLTNK